MLIENERPGTEHRIQSAELTFLLDNQIPQCQIYKSA